jgi:hypothetical protein
VSSNPQKNTDPKYWTNPLASALPIAPEMKIYCLYGVGKPTERAYPSTSLLDSHSCRKSHKHCGCSMHHLLDLMDTSTGARMQTPLDYRLILQLLYLKYFALVF